MTTEKRAFLYVICKKLQYNAYRLIYLFVAISTINILLTYTKIMIKVTALVCEQD